MPLPSPEVGLVICYEFLWSHEFSAGQAEGEKRRPSVLVVVTKNESGRIVADVAPITRLEPRDPSVAVEIPAKVKAHLGLDGNRSWVILDELNEFIWPGLDIYPIPDGRPDRFAYGFIPPKLFEQIKQKILSLDESKKNIIGRER